MGPRARAGSASSVSSQNGRSSDGGHSQRPSPSALSSRLTRLSTAAGSPVANAARISARPCRTASSSTITAPHPRRGGSPAWRPRAVAARTSKGSRHSRPRPPASAHQTSRVPISERRAWSVTGTVSPPSAPGRPRRAVRRGGSAVSCVGSGSITSPGRSPVRVLETYSGNSAGWRMRRVNACPGSAALRAFLQARRDEAHRPGLSRAVAAPRGNRRGPGRRRSAVPTPRRARPKRAAPWATARSRRAFASTRGTRPSNHAASTSSRRARSIGRLEEAAVEEDGRGPPINAPPPGPMRRQERGEVAADAGIGRVGQAELLETRGARARRPGARPGRPGAGSRPRAARGPPHDPASPAVPRR